MSKHTPGPWFISNKWEICSRSKEEDQSYGMLIPHGDVFGDNQEANAHLIAAAPDLLKALEMALVWLEYEGRYDVQGIRAVIDKAKGGSNANTEAYT